MAFLSLFKLAPMARSPGPGGAVPSSSFGRIGIDIKSQATRGCTPMSEASPIVSARILSLGRM